ncbi:alpha/beta hydrolase family protein [Flaviaesturariibacter amylovorans]|uniref:Alpha/beta hydrolase family protein n=1 Tax=Flaviaesturariibacter amylovorans TaxID=1084520 RepID=A0ABP8GC27_9BACT
MKHPPILILLFLLLAQGAGAQKPANVIDWKGDVMLNTWLVQRMQAQYTDRQKNFTKALRSRAAAEQYRKAVRARFRGLLGELPKRSPLNTTVTGTLQRKGYRIENIVFESTPGHHVTANLYLPEGKGPFPAALHFCGHEETAKATDSYQRTALLLVRSGFAVLSVDPVGQGERFQLTDSTGKPLTRGGTTEHTVLNAAALLVGSSLVVDELWDNVRALDYLVSRPEIDTARIGCLGNSGGAMQALYFAAFDERIKVVVPNSYVATRARTLELGGPADGCAQLPGEGAAGLEFADLLIAAAPRAVLVMAGRYDFIDFAGAQEAFGELKRFYTAVGVPDKAAFFSVEDGHGISRPKREAAVRWFRRWLLGDDRPVSEPPMNTETPAALFAAGGNVVTRHPGAVSLPELYRKRAAALARKRTQVDAMKPAQRAALLRQWLQVPAEAPRYEAEMKDPATFNGMAYQRLIVRTPEAPPVPVLLAVPNHGTVQRIVVLVSGGGMARVADSLSRLPAEARAGTVYVLADLRGTGETEDRAAGNDPKYYNREYRNAVLALHTGHSLPALRLRDLQTVMALATGLRNGRESIVLHAEGAATTVPALLLAHLDPSIRNVYLHGTLRSYADWLEHPEQKDLYSVALPGALAYFDLPDLLRLAGDRVQHLP